MFNKIVAIEPVLMTNEGKAELKDYAKEVVFFDTLPQSDQEIIDRINDADCILVSFTTKVNKIVLDACLNIKYIGMCCSYYGDQYSNLDMATAREKGISVGYLKDYGDEGVTEGILCQLISLLHGFGKYQWRARPYELTGLKIGIIGLGTTGLMTARAFNFLGADVYYFSRTRKEQAEKEGIKYLPLKEMLKQVDVVSGHLNRDVILMHEEEFEALGNGKIFITISIGRCYDVRPMLKWLNAEGNYYICDPNAKVGNSEDILNHPKTIMANKIFGHSKQTDERATKQTLAGIKDFLKLSPQ